MRTIIDYSIFPGSLLVGLLGAWFLLDAGIHNLLVTPLVVAPFVGLVWLSEYVRPEREHLDRDFPLILEGMHFIFNFEFGYGLALGAAYLVEYLTRLAMPEFWPGSWPMVFQFVLAISLYEASSYWQHRLFHRRPRLWAFHALHHSGARMDLFRAGRFHFVDFATVAFLAYLPLVVMGAPEDVITLMAVFVSILGLLHHSNTRQRTPGWMDYVICTPAVHRRHHSKLWHESDANFGNTLMIFDILFGSFAKPHPVGPETLGIDEDPLPNGFWAQLIGPFSGRAGLGPLQPEQVLTSQQENTNNKDTLQGS